MKKDESDLMSMAASTPCLPMQEYKLSFGSFQFYDDYVISAINEGVDLDADKLLQFYSLCCEVYQDADYSVIELRSTSFSIDPSFYIKYGHLLSNVKSHSMVVDRSSPAKLNEYVALCMKHCPCRAFYSVEDAITWAVNL